MLMHVTLIYQVWRGYHDCLHNPFATYKNMMMGKLPMHSVKNTSKNARTLIHTISVCGWHDRQAVIFTSITETSCLLYKKYAQIVKGIICYSTYPCCIKKLHEEIFCFHSHYFRIYTIVQCSAGKKFHYLTASNLIVKKAVLIKGLQ